MVSFCFWSILVESISDEERHPVSPLNIPAEVWVCTTEREELGRGCNSVSFILQINFKQEWFCRRPPLSLSCFVWIATSREGEREKGRRIEEGNGSRRESERGREREKREGLDCTREREEGREKSNEIKQEEREGVERRGLKLKKRKLSRITGEKKALEENFLHLLYFLPV